MPDNSIPLPPFPHTYIFISLFFLENTSKKKRNYLWFSRISLVYTAFETVVNTCVCMFGVLGPQLFSGEG